MQRWIAIGVGAMIVLLGGAYFGLKSYKQNRPSPIWVPMPINPELPIEKQDEIARELKKKLSDREILAVVSKDLGLMGEWKLPTDAACADELAMRMFVRAGEHETPMGKTPTINIGVNGKVKDRAVSEKISMRLMDDVFKILGIEPPPKKEF
ncbi:MAG: hypothetical protein WEB53_12255 [Akkermansiaceae bacterium]